MISGGRKMNCKQFVVLLLLVVNDIGSLPVGPSSYARCTTDYNCPQGEFCHHKGGWSYCHRCMDCKDDYNREPGVSGSCVKSRQDCGPCLQGFTEITPHCRRNAASDQSTLPPVTLKISTTGPITSEPNISAAGYVTGFIMGLVASASLVLSLLGLVLCLLRHCNTRASIASIPKPLNNEEMKRLRREPGDSSAQNNHDAAYLPSAPTLDQFKDHQDHIPSLTKTATNTHRYYSTEARVDLTEGDPFLPKESENRADDLNRSHNALKALPTTRKDWERQHEVYVNGNPYTGQSYDNNAPNHESDSDAEDVNDQDAVPIPNNDEGVEADRANLERLLRDVEAELHNPQIEHEEAAQIVSGELGLREEGDGAESPPLPPEEISLPNLHQVLAPMDIPEDDGLNQPAVPIDNEDDDAFPPMDLPHNDLRMEVDPQPANLLDDLIRGALEELNNRGDAGDRRQFEDSGYASDQVVPGTPPQASSLQSNTRPGDVVVMIEQEQADALAGPDGDDEIEE